MDTATLRASAGVPEMESGFIKNDLPVRILPDAMPGKIFEAKVSRSSGALDETTRTLLVEADLLNPGDAHKPGQFAAIKIAVEKHTGVLVVPVEALVMEKTNAFLFGVADGKAKKFPVTAGFNEGTQEEITTGLQLGEKVILVGKLTLTDGQPVTEAPAQPLSHHTMWTPYEKLNGRRPDFRVSYRFIPYSEGGRVQVPYQGYRSDFHYEGEDMQKYGIYMVWPEFLNADGTVIVRPETMTPESGEAFMWILFFDKMREYHRARAIPGRRGWFMEGAHKVAEATIIEQIGLAESKTQI